MGDAPNDPIKRWGGGAICRDAMHVAVRALTTVVMFKRTKNRVRLRLGSWVLVRVSETFFLS